MPHSFISCHVHYVFSTKDRQKLLTPDIQERLYPYLGGIARTNNMKALTVGGAKEHVHMLVSLPSTISIAKGIQLIKGGASKWVNEELNLRNRFEWQVGYGAFSIGISQVEKTISYIENQEEHHRTKTFQEEFLAFLQRHNIPYDPERIWD